MNEVNKKSSFTNVKTDDNESLRGLKKVKNIIAVSSCKGGVGKSTFSVNLAYTLKEMGAKVGLFDADIYGPSLPTLIHLDDYNINYEGDTLQPLNYDDIKLMSFGYVQETSGDSGPAVMRGPMVVQIIQQLLLGTDWDELDYLVIDMPPGTGDIQLTLGQIVPITASIIVTTPQKISYVDVVKGIQMYDSIQVPTVSIIENMSYFLCGKCNSKHHLFGQGTLDRLVEEFGFKHGAELPLIPELSFQSDKGIPYVKEYKDSSIAYYFNEIIQDIIKEIKHVKENRITPKIGFNDTSINIQLTDKDILIFKPKELRLKCQCAHCIDEFSGKQILKESDIDESISPITVKTVGNYAIGIEWSDNHTSLYSYEKLLSFS